MTRETIAVLLALGAALFIAMSDVIQQRSAHDVTDESVGHLALFSRLLADKRWWLGSLVAAVGFGLQAAALGLGSVLLVQSLLVTSLLFALALSARQSGRRPGRSVWLWAALLVAAEAVIIIVGNPTVGQPRAGLDVWTWVALVTVPAALLCLVGARLWPGRAAAMLLAAVSAMSWGIFAVLIKGAVDLLGHGLRPLLTAPELYAAVALAVIGTVFQQSSFRAGALTASLPTMTVLEPMVAAVLGVAVLGEVLRPARSGWAALTIAVAVLLAAVVVLSRDEAGLEDAQVSLPV